MENVSKALEMAAGVLIAVLIMSLVAYFFSSIGKLPSTEDEVETQAQLKAFNKEYEVYSKKGMYGVDVISCLNKARSNNEKYVEGNGFLTGHAYGSNYLIDVFFRIDEPLEESIEARFFDRSHQEVTNYENAIQGITLEDVGFFTKDIDPSNCYTSFKPNNELATKTVELDSDAVVKNCIVPNGGAAHVNINGEEHNYYSLLKNEEVTRLLKFSNLLRIEVRNTTNKDLDKWSSAIWKTALYDFKIKRFKCDDIKYSDKTGRVNEIYFSEIK